MAKTKLCQIIAVEKGVKSRSYGEFTEIHKILKKPALLTGIAKSYRPKDDEGDRLPGETTSVQVRAEDCLNRAATVLTEWFDVTATKDWSNCNAFADVVIEGETILTKVPVTYLMFLEKQLKDLHTFVKELPILDPAHEWHEDSGQSCFSTRAIETHRNVKKKKVLTLAPATDKHPAQVQLVDEDELAGYWTTIHFSGALEMTRVRAILTRVEKLQVAVKMAREEANSVDVNKQEVGKKIFDYLFA